ncbi:hypothetical protein [Chitinophaga silvisoli]|uniref:Uncharacterized protein n=1 Tax=Chitinophaga silvisoli TaxID=2291814 RepID=A0A3E1PA36_9BACT|nr:hypothetical protein [Chitinophaga silvisoli]RFM37043.1 hypothetical protein DXN04_05970 [Chitinophaga silvisoli]
MNERTKGAWIIHHANKLKQIEDHDFDDIDIAGKAGRLLSGLVASNEESTLSSEKVNVIAKGAGVGKAELPTILNHLHSQHLIDQSSTGEIVALGVTTSSVLSHTTNIFDNLNPNETQMAALSLAEIISSEPQQESWAREYVSDSHSLTKQQVSDLFQQAEEIGFIDSELVDDKKLLFNGNLFKTNSLQKARKVLDSLTPKERNDIANIDTEISKSGVIPFDTAVRIAGQTLLEKLQSIGMYEFNKVSNNVETKLFVTKPESFSKYGNPFEDDALDLAKAFVASLSYGMNYSSSSRGRIDLLELLLRALVNGRTVGPVRAIGHDYKYLEIKRVVQIIPEINGKYSMRLLKKEVGELALQVMQQGSATESVLFNSSSDVSIYDGPEKNRRRTRKKRQIMQSDAEVANILRTLRTT